MQAFCALLLLAACSTTRLYDHGQVLEFRVARYKGPTKWVQDDPKCGDCIELSYLPRPGQDERTIVARAAPVVSLHASEVMQVTIAKSLVSEEPFAPIFVVLGPLPGTSAIVRAASPSSFSVWVAVTLGKKVIAFIPSIMIGPAINLPFQSQAAAERFLREFDPDGHIFVQRIGLRDDGDSNPAYPPQTSESTNSPARESLRP
ncbi:MAG: hypothetical protein ACE5IL_04405 [Myxococcota bacterium]